MNLPTRSFTDIIRDMCAAITTSVGGLIDVSTGSVLRAIIESNAAIVLWVQWLVLLTLQTTRAATSAGTDLDSWMADFSLLRLPATAASGVVSFSRYSGVAGTLIPTGTVVKTQDGSVSFAVIVDPTCPMWQSDQNSYSMAPGIMSIDLPVTALVAGASGNVLSNSITVLASAVPGIDFANNGSATSGGDDPETDAAFRARFPDFFAARSRATLDAIGYAISLAGPQLSYVINENTDASGNTRLGNMLVIVDDGTGSLSETLLNSLSLAIGAVRPVGTTFSIQPPQIIQVQVRLSLTCPPDLSVSAIQNEVQSAIENYINRRGIGTVLSITRISQVAYQTEPRILNISDVMLNDQTTDLLATRNASFITESVSFI